MGIFSRKKKKTLPDLHVSIGQLEELKNQPFGTKGTIQIEGKAFTYHDAGSFYNTWQEIFTGGLYKFNASGPAPFIIDCGANMGLSVLFFKEEFPDAEIIAFEPDPMIFEVLSANAKSVGWQGVQLSNKAVWDTETTLTFYSDSGMGSSATNSFSKVKPIEVGTIRLADQLHRKVDMLKMDIEGAEYTVLRDCASLLTNVEHIFVEYHSFTGKEQHLDEVLSILKKAGFRYHLRESFSRRSPFVDNDFACENLELAINIFGYRH